MRWLVFVIALALAPAARAQAISDFSWMEGCWRTEAPREAEAGAVITEVWTAPPMPAMLGYSYTIGEGAVQGWEQTRIEMIDGWPHFVAMPNGAAPTRFRMREIDGIPVMHVWFDNPEHDFPKTVEYQRIGRRLIATISGAEGDESIRFEYHRISCAVAEIAP